MKKLLLLSGIVSMISCLLVLLFAVANMVGYYHLLDGSAVLYNRLYWRMIICFAVSVILGGIGTVCIIIYTKM